MTSIHRALADSATRYARRALTSHLEGDSNDFYLNAGIAVEHAMKSRLAREAPVFIADEKHFKSAIAFWKLANDFENLPAGTRTVGASVALDRVIDLEPGFAQHKQTVLEILRFRNGEAHIGSPGPPDRTAALVGFLRAINGLLRVPIEDFWAENSAFVATTLDESAKEVQQVVAAKTAAAKAAYATKRERLGEAEIAAVDEVARQIIELRNIDESVVEPCPACSNDCLLLGETSLDYDVTPDRDGYDATPFLLFQPAALQCPSCGLHLDSQDEVEAAGFELNMENDDADLSSYLAADQLF